MRYFNKNTRNIIIFSSLALVVLTILGYTSLSLNAQSSLEERAKELALKSAKSYEARNADKLFAPVDIEKMAYSNDKGGCRTKSTMFFIMSNKYKAGISAEQAAGNKMFAPLAQSVYDKIKKKGLEKATLDNIKEYQICISKAPRHKNLSKEYDLSIQQNACGELSGIILETLDYIKKRRKPGRLISKYERNAPDFTGTRYEGMQNPALLFIGQLYEASKTKKYQDVVELGSFIIIGCSG